MTTRSTRAIVEDMYSAYARRDFERVPALIHDDVDWIIYGPMQVFPFAGARRGKVAVLQALGGIAKDYVLERYEPKVMIVEGDRAAVMSEVAFQQRSTGRTLRFAARQFPPLRGRPPDRISRIRQFLRSGGAGAGPLYRMIQ